MNDNTLLSETATLMNKKSAQFLNQLDEWTKSIQEQSPGWLKDLRKASLEKYIELGVPTVKDEEWKYTNLAPVVGEIYLKDIEADLKETDELNAYCGTDAVLIVFLNGKFDASRSKTDNVPEGITIEKLQNLSPASASELKIFYDKFEPQKDTAFMALNNALLEDGVFIHIKEKAIVDELIHIVHITSSGKKRLLSAPRTFIKAEKSSEATILESHLSFDDNSVYFTNALSDIIVNENATLHYAKAQKESLKAYHIGNTRVWQERNSNFDGFSLMAGSAINRNNLDIIINGEGANATLNGLYSIFGNQHVDNHTVVDHREPNCTSNQLYKGILNGSSRAVFNGKIFVQSIAQKTNSYQLNKNLLLGDKCRVDTKPQLEIFADDVKCTHGATVGQLDEDELFYLQTRTISRKEATRMLSRGFVDDILNGIASDVINQKLHLLLEPSFAQLQ